MKLFFASFAVLLLLSSVTRASTSPTNSANSKDIKAEREECPRAFCANPVYTEGNPCPICLCVFRGCVHFGAFGATWKPDNCTTCTCNQNLNQAICYNRTECGHLECYGYPSVRKPGKCCPECDFGIAKNECGIIPVRMEFLNTAYEGSVNCQQKVRKHGCDKTYIISEDGQWYKCVAIKADREVHLDTECSKCKNEERKVTYKDTVSCEKKRIVNNWEIPQDYDPDPTSCALYIP